MEYEIVTLGEKLVEGILIRTENKEGKGAREIGALWEDFLSTGKQELIQNRANGNCIGLYMEYDGDYTKPYSYLAGCEVTQESEKAVFPVRKICAGKYAKFTAKGDLQQEVQKIWEAVWSLPLERCYQSDFEEYMEAGGINPEIAIYIGVR